MANMKLFLVLLLIVMGGCTAPHVESNENDASHPCDLIQDVDWSRKSATIRAYKKCINTPIDGATGSAATRWSQAQTDAKLYLSYIYLMPGLHHSIRQGNKYLTQAIREMGRDCIDAHGTYDNFCYMLYSTRYEHIPRYFPSITHAMHLYHMSMPCVHAQMIIENPDAIDLIDSYFGSSRDANIPRLCDGFNPYDIIDMPQFVTLANAPEFIALYSDGPMTGTMRFGIYQSNYNKMVKMLLLPDIAFQDMDLNNPFVINHGLGGQSPTKTFLIDIEENIEKHPDLSAAYHDMIAKTTAHYESYLGLAPDQATKFARITVLNVIYNYILY